MAAYRRQIVMATVVGAILIGLYLLSSPVGNDGETATTAIPGGADPADVAVIDEWAHTLSRGDIHGAAEFFAIPSLAQNGLTLRIDSFAKAKLFNSSLPCGALLVEATTDGEFTVATFRLTERSGRGVCDAAAEAEARTAFKIEDGKIVVWRRVPDESGGEAQPAPSSSA
ncbi:MAG: hypothetical protein QOI10_1384 [Solirubrobacterales bacterium]|jgi:hypothetical protein|nr:hypothetical protein [Solirubrobacterales bacterium]